jgi:IS30 family transposase
MHLKGVVFMCKNKHLSLEERFTIERELGLNKSFKSIAKLINKDCITISKEIRSHYKIENTGAYGKAFNNCLLRKDRNVVALCNDCHQSRNRLCRNCHRCKSKCDKFIEEKCSKLSKHPYVCNGCNNRSRCTLTKHIYDAAYSFNEFKLILSESRSGVINDQEEIDNLNNILVPLICEQKQSIHHAYINNINIIMYSEKIIYKLSDLGVLKVRNIDLPRKVRFRLRRKNNLR